MVIIMQDSHIYEEYEKVTEKLSFFGATKEELLEIALAAAANRNNASSLQPKNAPGTLSYIYGVEALRRVFIRKEGWKPDFSNGVESVFNEELNVKILFQNVDSACGSSNPQAISGKGLGVAKLLETNNTGYLFDFMQKDADARVNSNVWFYCVFSNGDELRAELSLPHSIKGSQFSYFRERIFILTGEDWSPIDENFENDGQDFDVDVSRK